MWKYLSINIDLHVRKLSDRVQIHAYILSEINPAEAITMNRNAQLNDNSTSFTFLILVSSLVSGHWSVITNIIVAVLKLAELVCYTF